MFTYQVRQRIFAYEKGHQPIFPNEVEIVFEFSPLHLFGCGESGGRTGTIGIPSKFEVDLFSGRHSLLPPCGLSPLFVFLEEPGRKVFMRGHKLHIREHCESASGLEERVQDLFFGIPILLNIEMYDPPIVKIVYGRVGKVPFVWKLHTLHTPIHLTNQNMQQKIIQNSWKRWSILAIPDNKRIFAALHYFHIACRLKATGYSPWEFTGEVILNLCKALEVLFPKREGITRKDAVTEGLTILGYSASEVEKTFLPAMDLRDNMDSGHIRLFDLQRESFEILYDYTDTAELAFQKMFQKLISKIQKGEYTLTPYSLIREKQKDAEKVIRKIRESKNIS